MSSDDYDVGYKKPPTHSQFKKGQSGNPKGRPKGVKNLATDLQEEMTAKIQITEDGKTQMVTKQRAMVKRLVAKALSGDNRSASTLLKLIESIEAREDGKEVENLSPSDQALLDKYLKKSGGSS